MKKNMWILLVLSFGLVSACPVWANPNVKVTIEEKGKKIAGLGEEITLTVTGLEDLKKEAEQKKKAIIPCVNGLPLKGIKSYLVDKDTMKFFLIRTPESKDAWKALLDQKNGFFTRKASISVGLEDGLPVETEVNDFQIVVIQKWRFYFLAAVFLFFLILLLWLARGSEILRNSGPKPEGGKKRTYSLGLSQMAIWFVIIIGSYLFLWLSTGDLGTLTDSVLGLMGISAGTAIGAAIIDSGKRTVATTEREKLQAERDTLTANLKALEEKIATDPKLNELKAEKLKASARIQEIDDQLNNLPAVEKGVPSQGWLFDVLSDVNGISFHRFQMLAWTFVLVIIFLTEVYNNLKMPEFSGTLLGLMGISSGTYIGFKFPEKNY